MAPMVTENFSGLQKESKDEGKKIKKKTKNGKSVFRQNPKGSLNVYPLTKKFRLSPDKGISRRYS